MSGDLRPGENPEVGKVSGYRKLSDDELQLVNDWKTLGSAVLTLLERTEDVIGARNEKYGVADSEGYRALALARTNFQQGAMWAIRAAAAPNGLF
ncbi:MAG TPA: hypothetical protein PKZ27_02920 [Rhodocyclaceae bacterium]|nr:hypothetical protein [Burkholderiaceae bacterium]HRP74518.1 hypothetical protein [Rhodocyclaceae bacterium]